MSLDAPPAFVDDGLDIRDGEFDEVDKFKGGFIFPGIVFVAFEDVIMIGIEEGTLAEPRLLLSSSEDSQSS